MDLAMVLAMVLAAGSVGRFGEQAGAKPLGVRCVGSVSRLNEQVY